MLGGVVQACIRLLINFCYCWKCFSEVWALQECLQDLKIPKIVWWSLQTSKQFWKFKTNLNKQFFYEGWAIELKVTASNIGLGEAGSVQMEKLQPLIGNILVLVYVLFAQSSTTFVIDS